MEAAADLVASIKQAAEDEEWGDKLLSELSKAGKNKLDLYLVVSGFTTTLWTPIIYNSRRFNTHPLKIDREIEAPEPVWHPVDASITMRLPTRPDTPIGYYTPGRITKAVQDIFGAGPGKDHAAEKVEQSIPITATKPALRVKSEAASKSTLFAKLSDDHVAVNSTRMLTHQMQSRRAHSPVP